MWPLSMRLPEYAFGQISKLSGIAKVAKKLFSNCFGNNSLLKCNKPTLECVLFTLLLKYLNLEGFTAVTHENKTDIWFEVGLFKVKMTQNVGHPLFSTKHKNSRK